MLVVLHRNVDVSVIIFQNMRDHKTMFWEVPLDIYLTLLLAKEHPTKHQVLLHVAIDHRHLYLLVYIFIYLFKVS